MLQIQKEKIISFREAANILPRRRAGKRPHIATLYRWGDEGCQGIILETVQIGGTRCTSVEALDRFFHRLTETRSARFVKPRNGRANSKPPAQSAIEAELDAEGL